MKRVMFKIGDSVFYPAAGVGVIETVEDIFIGGQWERCFVIRIRESQVTIKVPQSNIQKNGIRPLLNERKLKELFRVLSEQSCATTTASNTIEYYKTLERKINTGSCLELGEVVRDLMRQKQESSLSFDEARLLETASNFLSRELAAVAGIAPGVAYDRIRSSVVGTAVGAAANVA